MDSVNERAERAFKRYRERRILVFTEKQGMTEEQAASAFDRQQKAMESFVKASEAACLDAEAKGLRKGSGGLGQLPCPACESGTLHYSVATSNGHLWGKCTTEGCASWLQ